MAQEYSEDYTDWEGYYSDEFYDTIPTSKAKPQTQASSAAATGKETVSGPGLKRKSAGQSTPKKHKRRKMERTRDIPELSLSESLDPDGDLSGPCSPNRIVIWKTEETFTPLKWPIVGDQDGEKVALMEDWRERFKLASKPDGGVVGGMAKEQEGGVMGKSKGIKPRTIPAGQDEKPETGKRSLKPPASRKKEVVAEPRKRVLPSRQAPSLPARLLSGLPTASRKRKAEEDLPNTEKETDKTSRGAATADGRPVRKAVAVVIPSMKSKSAPSQKKSIPLEPVEKKANGVPSATNGPEAGAGDGKGARRSKRSKAG